MQMEKPKSTSRLCHYRVHSCRKSRGSALRWLHRYFLVNLLISPDDEGKWLYIRCLDDQYEGWIDDCIDFPPVTSMKNSISL